MGISSRFLRTRFSHCVLFTIFLFLILGAVAGPVVFEKARQEAIKGAVRAYFSASDSEEAQEAWTELVEFGAEDFGFLLWGLERTNAVFMFPPGKLKELIGDIEKAAGGSEAVLDGCSRALESDLTVGKCLAMDILAQSPGRVAPADVEIMRAILMDTKEHTFVRRKAARVLAALEAEGAGEDLLVICSRVVEEKTDDETEPPESKPEPLSLRELSLSLLTDLSSEKAKEETAETLSDPKAEYRLFLRSADCAVRLKDTDVLSRALQAESDSKRKGVLLKALLCLGDEASREAVEGFLGERPGGKDLASVLDGIAETEREGFEGLVKEILTSPDKAARLRALRAVERLCEKSAHPEFDSKLEELLGAGTPEETYLIEHMGR